MSRLDSPATEKESGSEVTQDSELSRFSNRELVERVLSLESDAHRLKQDVAESKENEEVLLKELRRLKIEVGKHYDITTCPSKPGTGGEVERLRKLLDSAWSEGRKAREAYKAELRSLKERLSNEARSTRSLAAERRGLLQELELAQKQLKLSRERCVDMEARIESAEAKLAKEKEAQQLELNQLSNDTDNKYLKLSQKYQSTSVSVLFQHYESQGA